VLAQQPPRVLELMKQIRILAFYEQFFTAAQITIHLKPSPTPSVQLRLRD
jgi:hypothetical protein